MLKELWKNCKNILCIRPDNMGDLLMTVPAIRALKESTGAKITVLTSSMAAVVAGMIPEIDEVMIYDVPWVKNTGSQSSEYFMEIIDKIRVAAFDAAVIFTVYSQNPLPAVMLAYLARIPLRLAYCRENPYALLTDWVPDVEPFSEIKHQVRRDLDLVARIGAIPSDERLSVRVGEQNWHLLKNRLLTLNFDAEKPWLIFHPGVSEEKREYPIEKWIGAGRVLAKDFQIAVTGGRSEKQLTEAIAEGIGESAYSLAGIFSLEEFVLLIKKAPLVISVNTGTVHLAAATGTPVIVLYALTNPQHFPWKSLGKVLLFNVRKGMRSQNEVIRWVNEHYFPTDLPEVSSGDIVTAAYDVFHNQAKLIPELPVEVTVSGK